MGIKEFLIGIQDLQQSAGTDLLFLSDALESDLLGADFRLESRYPATRRGQAFPRICGRAFGLAVGLSRRASFPWSDFVRRLSEQIASSPDDTTPGYYRQWLAALEHTIVDHGIASNDELSAALTDALHEHEHEHDD